MELYNFSFIKTIDIESLTNAIVFINRTRRHPFRYKRVIQTAPRNGWIAVIIDSPGPDHYLIRNISGRIKVRAFELSTNGLSMSYRLHAEGKTVAAYESHLSLWITQQLRALMATGDVTQIDLAEPAGRLILKRYHEYRRSWSWTSSKSNESVTPDIEWHYSGRAEDLKEYFRTGTDQAYVQDMIKPGIAVETAFQRLLEVMELPYIKGEPVIAELTDSHEAAAQPPEVKPTATSPSQHDTLDGQKVLKGTTVLQPGTWDGSLQLPRGWLEITENQWKTEQPLTATSTSPRH